MFDQNGLDLNRAFLSVGSNVGERERSVLRGMRRLDSSTVRVLQMSSLFETEPLDCAPMRRFVNAVVEVNTLLPPGDLLKRLQALERDLGRRNGHNEPRPLDVDIVAYGNLVQDDAALTIPHPRYRHRLFVLAPLAEIAPSFRCPQTGIGVETLLERIASSQIVTRISSRHGWAPQRRPRIRQDYAFASQEQVDE